MEYFLVITIMPIVLLSVLFFITSKISFLEYFGGLAAIFIVGLISIGILMSSSGWDNEILNGYVVKKSMERVSCGHQYCCSYGECCSGSGKDRSCYTCCQSYCDEHPYDIDWAYYFTLDNNMSIQRDSISRIDRQGLKMPSRWEAIQKNDPVAVSHSYRNYIKASEGSLFQDESEAKKSFPSYPEIYDIYKINRVINIDVKGIDPSFYNGMSSRLAEILRTVGPAKQVNIVILFTIQGEDIFYEMKKSWHGGKKNDVIVMIGLDETKHIKWARASALADNNRVLTEIQLDLASIQDPIDKEGVRENILSKIEQPVMYYHKRKSMKKFEYLKYSFVPSIWSLVFAFISNLAISIFYMYYALNNDITRD